MLQPEHNDATPLYRRNDLATRLNARDTWHSDIQNCNVGTIIVRLMDGFLPRRSFRDHMKLLMVLQQSTQTCPDYRMIIRNENSHRHKDRPFFKLARLSIE
jgi:hypothetical protein